MMGKYVDQKEVDKNMDIVRQAKAACADWAILNRMFNTDDDDQALRAGSAIRFTLHYGMGMIDFWPRTGTWMTHRADRSSVRGNGGPKNMLRVIQKFAETGFDQTRGNELRWLRELPRIS